ncbi:uncharacterized protein F5Z01DRAFT_636483 [Emericellopsis atlantica]|uniref:Uncharacterized protein n=1 Tax=Emericellopsis atlantica TaxID=2614577 RepID=A0A9P7ZMI9_9HYPO|nr:uncharacterized protein F5Z01DRAFT_636483 [Emericellopsis atlantica]KAG9254406.1 hypothetical protein F5Z01DRAFT_636483 [Emericellopsis atlantica]
MFALLLFVALVRGLCYTPDGTITNDVACDPTSEHSMCCTAGFCVCQMDCVRQRCPLIKDQIATSALHAQTRTGGRRNAQATVSRLTAGNPSGGEWVMECDEKTQWSPTGQWCCQYEDCCTDKDATRQDIGDALVTATAGKRQVTSTKNSEPSSSTAGDKSE